MSGVGGEGADPDPVDDDPMDEGDQNADGAAAVTPVEAAVGNAEHGAVSVDDEAVSPRQLAATVTELQRAVMQLRGAVGELQPDRPVGREATEPERGSYRAAVGDLQEQLEVLQARCASYEQRAVEAADTNTSLRNVVTGNPGSADGTVPAVRAASSYKTPVPDKFSGAADKRRIEDWLNLVQLFFLLSHVPLQYWAASAQQLLTDQAAAHFPDLSRGMDMMQMSWQKFSELLTLAYGRNDREPVARADLDALRQTGSVQTYARVFRELVSCITKFPMSEGDKMHRFKTNLALSLRSKCAVRPDGAEWGSLEELISFAVRTETSMNVTRASANFRSGSAHTALSAALDGPAFAGAAAARSAVKTAGGAKRPRASSGGGPSSAVKKTPSSGNLTPFGTTQVEHTRRKNASLCYYCCESHRFQACPLKKDAMAMKKSPAGNTPTKPLTDGTR